MFDISAQSIENQEVNKWHVLMKLVSWSFSILSGVPTYGPIIQDFC